MARALLVMTFLCGCAGSAPEVVGTADERDPVRARELYRELCVAGDPVSCSKLCEEGSTTHCTDLEVMHLAANGGSPYPPVWYERTTVRLRKGCREGDDMACLLLHLDYRSATQPVVVLMNDCRPDRRCYQVACVGGDPVGCAAACRIGESDACADLAALGIEGRGFKGPRVAEALAMAASLCKAGHKPACSIGGPPTPATD